MKVDHSHQASGEDARLEKSLADLAAVMSFPTSPGPTPPTLHPQPYTLNPTPSTLYPTPSTLHPQLYTRTWRR